MRIDLSNGVSLSQDTYGYVVEHGAITRYFRSLEGAIECLCELYRKEKLTALTGDLDGLRKVISETDKQIVEEIKGLIEKGVLKRNGDIQNDSVVVLDGQQSGRRFYAGR